jgi:nitrogen permease regulator 3-like protein
MSMLWKDIIDVSSLAACMQDIYDAVSHNKIAALQLDTPEGTIAHSVQIPVPFYLTDLPPEEEAAKTRGLWLTTANYFVEEDSLQDPSFLDKNFGLLLMSDEKKIIAELQADADEATNAMVEFVRLSKPTMSYVNIRRLIQLL